MTVQIVNELIHFGAHYLPIDTARSFWIFTDTRCFGFEGPLVQVTLGSYKHPKNHVVYQMRTETLERANCLAMELLTKTEATMYAGFKAIQPLVTKINGKYHGSIKLEFWDKEKNDLFNTLIGSTLFPRKKFCWNNKGRSSLFIVLKGSSEKSQIIRIKEILGILSRLTAGYEVEKLLRRNRDEQFTIESEPSQYPEPEVLSVPQLINPGFVVTLRKLYRICFGPANERSEEPLFCAAPIFSYVGEESNPGSHRAQAQSPQES